MTSKKPRILFSGEAVSLAHISRPLILATWAREAGYDVHFACARRSGKWARQHHFKSIDLPTVESDVFFERIQQGRFFYQAHELRDYVFSERELLNRLKPDLVVSDFRLTLDISTALCGIPLLSLANGYWNPLRSCLFDPPSKGFGAQWPQRIRKTLFTLLRPLAFRFFGQTLDRVRKEYGLPAHGDFRKMYTAGKWCAYPDLPEFIPSDRLLKGHFYLGPLLWRPKVLTFSDFASWWRIIARHANGPIGWPTAYTVPWAM